MSTNTRQNLLTHEVERRRTFAIISHPDAGKTTMTEKLLLYGGAIHLAGSVKSRKAERHATSDWMEIEKQRGISVTSSVMQFEYEGNCINILDTPGHQDFSEETSRPLHAADSAVMLLDGGRGVEQQTIKLFHVCRQRGIPIFTFINKMDRAAKNPFDLMDELEKVLGIRSAPINWPIGTHGDFKGVYDRQRQEIDLFSAGAGHHGSKQAELTAYRPDDPELRKVLEQHYIDQLAEDIELLDIAGDPLDEELVAAGLLTPLFFGSALTNFGVEPFLREFLRMAPAPAARKSNLGPVQPDDEAFSGFVFKIQANMNPQHRDRLAFIRICSGVFQPEMDATLTRTGRPVRLARPQQIMAQERVSVTAAYAGDIVGVFDPGNFLIGDTIHDGSRGELAFEPIPAFAPEFFARIEPVNSLKRKQFLRGMNELVEEGTAQVFREPDAGTGSFIAGVVGKLQFEVLEYRLQNEYGVDVRLTHLPFREARWVRFAPDAATTEAEKLNVTSTTLLVLDRNSDPVLLFESPWALDWALERNRGLQLLDINAE